MFTSLKYVHVYVHACVGSISFACIAITFQVTCTCIFSVDFSQPDYIPKQNAARGIATASGVCSI